MSDNTYNGLKNYFSELNNFQLLNRDEEFELGMRSLEGDLDARNELIQANLKLVVTIAHSYKGHGVQLSELIAEGNIGLMKAAEKFDPRKGVKFSSYSALWIKKSMRVCLTKFSRTIRIPINSVRKIIKIKESELNLEKLLNRLPTDEEIAEYLEYPLLTIKRLRNTELNTTSLNLKPTDIEEGYELQDFVADETIQSPLEEIISREQISEVQKYFDFLKDRQRQILVMRYGLNKTPLLTLDEISKRLFISRERVRQIQNDALNKLRLHIKDSCSYA